jgi:hypothetical protein
MPKLSGKKKKTSRIQQVPDYPMFSGGEKNRSMNVSAVIGNDAVPLYLKKQRIQNRRMGRFSCPCRSNAAWASKLPILPLLFVCLHH